MIVNNTERWADNPQAAEIDSLIERAGRLTDDEMDALSKEWCAADSEASANVAGGASWYASRYASWYAARRAARRAASADVAWGAVGANAAYYAAGNAAAALAIRDLIDEKTPWNQKAYNTLTAPWAKVIGKVHPDDVVRA